MDHEHKSELRIFWKKTREVILVTSEQAQCEKKSIIKYKV